MHRPGPTRGRQRRRLPAVAFTLAALPFLGGCTTLAYYAQAVHGHLDLLARAQPLQTWLDAASTPAPLRAQLLLAQRLRRFAVSELKLPDTHSYRRYAELPRRAAVWNVVAAPELSLTLRRWCFPLMGCVGYRGYFDRADADALAGQLRGEGLEVLVYGVPAYSTLGWTEWLGGDPLLSTFIDWPEADLARLIFHELAHQVAYAADDTTFNESFATAVERLGSRQWLAAHPAAQREVERADARRADWRAFMQRQRERLRALYDEALDAAAMRARKAALMQSWRSEYEAMKRTRWGGYAGYDDPVAQANNASFGVQAAYDELVPAFERLFAREGGDWARFHAQARRLAALPRAERRAALDAASAAPSPSPSP
jgi:predicted aminopeptidase